MVEVYEVRRRDGLRRHVIPNFIKIGLDIENLKEGIRRHTDTQTQAR
jgi:hypothetical protein